MSTTPRAVPRAQPLRAPPFGRHLAHASARVAPERWVRRGRARGTARGVVLTHNGGGVPLPFGAPASRVALMSCAAPLRHME